MISELIIIGDIFEVIGTVLIAYMALAVHEQVRHEQKIDRKVFGVIRQEKVLAYTGMILIVGGFLLRVAGGAY
ncbi:hypothetical protein DYH10_03040 [Candidatus Saccharibacteria bacterium CPR2]|nr:hypothetical protein [Candidatus Saccharibacteria bacterium CPR2]